MSGWLTKYVPALCAGAASVLLMPAAGHAESLIENVNGMTLNSEGKVIRFTAMLVDDDGKVKQLLDRRDKRPREVDFQFDGKGQTLVPGFFDAHGHVMGTGFAALTLDLSDTKTLAEALAKIAQYAADNPSRQWIMGNGWNQETWGLGR